MSALLAQVKAAAEAKRLKDQTAEPAGYSYEPPVAGKCYARFVEYIERGKRPQKPHMGKAKPDCHEAVLGFELLGQKHAKEVEVDGVKKTVYPMIRIRTTIKGGDRSNFSKLMKAMTYGRDITHLALMLEEGFIVTVHHNKSEKDGKEVVYANLYDANGDWSINAPRVLADPSDPTCEEYKPVKVPPQTAQTKLLLWDYPTKEQWDSIFIDGTHTEKDKDGSSKEVSNNRIQEDLLKAVDFSGSALETLLLELAGDALGDALGDPSAAPEPGQDELLDDGPAEDTAIDEPAPAGKEGAGKAASAEAADPLAELGFC